MGMGTTVGRLRKASHEILGIEDARRADAPTVECVAQPTVILRMDPIVCVNRLAGQGGTRQIGPRPHGLQNVHIADARIM